MIAITAIGVTLGLGSFGINEYVKFKREAAAAAAMIEAANDGDVYTGSILFTPDRGVLCRQLLFDNLTGQVSDNGYVDCIAATYRSADDQPVRWPTARVRVISTGFQRQ